MWWNDVLKRLEPRMSPAKMCAKYGGVHADWVDENGNAKTNGDWNWKPDVSAVADVPVKYWKGTNVVTEMTQAEKDAVDAQERSERQAEIRAALKERFNQADDNTKAMGLLMLQMYNLIKSEIKPQALNNALPDITPAQLKARFTSIVDGL